jgi:cytochrome c-type biogenesis protein CcmH/NrfG
MGYAFSLLRREEEAAECYQRARQLAPRNQNYLRHWLEVMIRLGKGTEAMV